MRQDESDTVVLFVLTPVRHILVDTVIPNNHILHSLLVKGAIGAFGNEPWVVRLPAFLAGVLVIPLTFLVGRVLYSTRAGLLAASIVAISTPMVLYSTNARGYTLIAAATLGCLYCLCVALQSSQVRWWGAFACIAAAGAFVTPSMLYPVGGMVMWAMLELFTSRPVDWRRVRLLVLACCVAAVLSLLSYGPAIAVSGLRSIMANSYVRPMSWSRFFEQLPRFVSDLGDYVTAAWPIGLTVLIALALAFGLIAQRKLARHRWPVALVMLAWAVVLLVGMRRAPYLRVWLFLVPVFAIPAGAGLAAALDRLRIGSALARAGAVAQVLTLGMGLVLVQRRAPDVIRETGVFVDGEPVARRLADVLVPGDAIAARWLAQGPVDYYLRRMGLQADFVARNDSVSGRLYLIASDDQDETPASLIEFWKLRGVEATRSRPVAPFSRSSIWIIDAPMPNVTPAQTGTFSPQ
ncbi:MAG: glycosyltransferase family 39 protein [Gemmatimonadaceae bacterium]